MENIDIDVYEVEQVASSLNELSQQLSAQINNLSQISEIMNTAMVSSSSAIYGQIADALGSDISNAAESLSNVSDFLMRTAKRVRKAEEQIKKIL